MIAVTGAMVAAYLQTHPIPDVTWEPFFGGKRKVPGRPEFLVRDTAGALWLVRFPNNSVRWVTDGYLAAAHIARPAAGPILGVAGPDLECS